MKQKLDEMDRTLFATAKLERLEEEYREVKNRIEILRESLVETVNEECIKFDLRGLERTDCNSNYFQKKMVLKILSQKLSEIAIEYMDKYVLGCDNEVD